MKKWLDIPNNKSYENFLITWHDLRKEMMKKIADRQTDVSDEWIKQINMKLLHIFYEEIYNDEDFYPQFESRYEQMRKEMNLWVNP